MDQSHHTQGHYIHKNDFSISSWCKDVSMHECTGWQSTQTRSATGSCFLVTLHMHGLATASWLYCDNIYTGCIVDSSQSDSIYGCYKWTHFLCQHGKNIGKKYNLFPQGSILVLSQFISWINLNFGIEVCFVPGLTGYIKAWLQFVFPGYIFLILLLIVIFARYSKRLLNLVGTQVVPVLATLFLLSYTKLIRSVIQALYVTYVSCDGQPQAVWFVDGNIMYFSGGHLPLFIFALLVLIFLITPYTLFLLTSPFIEVHLTGYRCFRWVFRLKPVLDAYGGPYNDRFRVWTRWSLHSVTTHLLILVHWCVLWWFWWQHIVWLVKCTASGTWMLSKQNHLPTESHATCFFCWIKFNWQRVITKLLLLSSCLSHFLCSLVLSCITFY